MHKIGILSDTHGMLRPEVMEALQGCEMTGSCGPRRFHQEITLALLYIEENGGFRIEKRSIPHTERKSSGYKSLKKDENRIPEDIALCIQGSGSEAI